jgi:hypothetical protein
MKKEEVHSSKFTVPGSQFTVKNEEGRSSKLEEVHSSRFTVKREEGRSSQFTVHGSQLRMKKEKVHASFPRGRVLPWASILSPYRAKTENM